MSLEHSKAKADTIAVAITKPIYDWSNSNCNNGCQPGKFCIGVQSLKVNLFELVKNQDENQAQDLRNQLLFKSENRATGYCICGDNSKCDDVDVQKDCRLRCNGRNKYDGCNKDDLGNTQCDCKDGYTGVECEIDLNANGQINNIEENNDQKQEEDESQYSNQDNVIVPDGQNSNKIPTTSQISTSQLIWLIIGLIIITVIIITLFYFKRKRKYLPVEHNTNAQEMEQIWNHNLENFDENNTQAASYNEFGRFQPSRDDQQGGMDYDNDN